MFNNVRDHSQAEAVQLFIERTALTYTVSIHDFGVGIFDKIQRDCGLPTKHEAVLELSKGKLTTDPTRHTGEGIFFTSRMFDRFAIFSGGLMLARTRQGPDWLLDTDATLPHGTSVQMILGTDSAHTTREVFDRYTTESDDYGFTKTHVLVSLANIEGGTLVSRSQAKRLLARLDRFKEVVLNFDKLDDIGPAFADEIFRVFALEHPHVRLQAVNTSDRVDQMIRRARAAAEVDKVK